MFNSEINFFPNIIATLTRSKSVDRQRNQLLKLSTSFFHKRLPVYTRQARKATGRVVMAEIGNYLAEISPDANLYVKPLPSLIEHCMLCLHQHALQLKKVLTLQTEYRYYVFHFCTQTTQTARRKDESCCFACADSVAIGLNYNYPTIYLYDPNLSI